jgi:pimeloyl-ACP methyl ester carboxylesterase
MSQVQREYFSPATAEAATLAIILHGLGGCPQKMGSVRSATEQAYPGCAVYVPKMPYASPLCRECPGEIAAGLLDQICVLMDEGDYARVVFIGHSMSSLIARKAVVLAHGEHIGAPFEPGVARHAKAKPWAGRIDRLILLAGISRGWSTTAAQNWTTGVGWSLLSLIGDIVFNGRLTILGIRLGSPFVVQTRLQWLELTSARTASPIVTVQLLGSRDNTVSPEDTVDFAVDLGNCAFVLIDLPHTDHEQAIALDGDGPAAERRCRFIAALTRSPDALEQSGISVPASIAANGAPPMADTQVTDVVFVIHGIRDKGFWTRKVARRIMEEARSDPSRVVRSMTLSYGYLAMLPFILPWVRRDKVRWLMDHYAHCRALFPLAAFSYVGHSNGTYLAARALRDYPAARFKRIVFAGSVVRSDYDWVGAITGARGQVEGVMNYVASADWIVAIFPNGFSRFRLVDLGGAGHHGFMHLMGPKRNCPSGAHISSVTIGQSQSHQIDYVSGGHGAGIKESQWDEIARFIVHGVPPEAIDPDFVGKQSGLVAGLGRLPPLSLIAAALLVAALIYFACTGAATIAGVSGVAAVAVISLLLAYLLLTRF